MGKKTELLSDDESGLPDLVLAKLNPSLTIPFRDFWAMVDRADLAKSIIDTDPFRFSYSSNTRTQNSGTYEATLLGAVTSDALEDGRVVSGVGGQYNFVAQAHELENARSIILLRATRDNAGKTESNIVWSYGHVTVPRHLRDIIITEYGVADLRGQPDEECVKRMLAITDARFIDELVDDAKSARKLSEDFQVPDAWYRNRPETISKALATFEGDLPPYPFGTEMDMVEQELAPVLEHLKAVSAAPLDHFDVILKALMSSAAAEKHKRYLDRLNLTSARSIRNWFLKKLVLSGLRTD